MRSGLLFAIITMLAVSCLADTFIVDLNGNGDYLTIQDAIDGAIDGDTILIRDGIYTGEGNCDIDFKGKAITVTSENGSENCIVDCKGTSQEPHRGFNFIRGENRNSILCDITIINGYAPNVPLWASMYSCGGAIYCKGSKPYIINCIIANNKAKYYGGGIYCYESDALIDNCIIKDNTCTEYDTAGGGFASLRGSPIVNRCIIKNNSARTGGGIDSYYNTNKTLISNCLIVDNKAKNGAGMRCYWGYPRIKSSTFSNNIADSSGGGVYCRGESVSLMINCIVWGNESCSIFGEHRVDEIKVSSSNADIIVSFSNIRNGWLGVGNIDNDPLYVNPEENDFHLMSVSPCIDTGAPDSDIQPDETDLDGNPRIDNGIIDMGAYEYIHPLRVWLDIKPQSCPNPVNVKSNGVLPVAILGTDLFDVNGIDIDTITLEGIPPIRFSYEDVATPVYDERKCSCSSEGQDGYVDLTLKFDTQELINVLGDVIDGEEWLFNLSGSLFDGTAIEGSDCIIIRKKGKAIVDKN